jgi:Tol biopolymer transport system component
MRRWAAVATLKGRPTTALRFLVFFLIAAPGLASNRYDSSLDFQTLTTAHFVIHFHQGERQLAERLAAIAEDVHDTMVSRAGDGGDRVTRVVLVDQSDLSNGWATPFPYNTIEISAVPPPAASLIGLTDDWLRLVFTHEYTHIVHLDRSRGWAAGARKLFGRPIFAFPNLFLPVWQIEGLATLYETRLTGQGRLREGDFTAMLGTQVRARGIEPIDRASGGLADWPAGVAPYLYGSHFHDYLASTYGEPSLWRLADATAGGIPFFQSHLFKHTYDRAVKAVWADFQSRYATLVSSTRTVEPRRLTHHGYEVVGPRWDPASPGRIIYSVRNADQFPSLMAVDATAPNPEPADLGWRFLGDRVSPAREAIFLDQLEIARNVSLFADLYAIDRCGGQPNPRRLTSGLRASDPDVSPDGRRLAITLVQSGRRSLAVIALDSTGRQIESDATPIVIAAADEVTSFEAPRWSPDGRFIAAERRGPGVPSAIVLLASAGGKPRTLFSEPGARSVTPAWTPDGRTVIFAAERAGAPFNLYAVDVDTGHRYQVTDLSTSASSPDVSPDGRTIAFVGYTPDGFDLFTIPFDRSSWMPIAEPAASRPPAADDRRGVPPSSPAGPSAPAPYSPWNTLRPYYWEPMLDYRDDQFGIGGATSGGDVLGRHLYSASVLWWTDRGRPDWTAGYVYDRWRPSFFVTTSDERPSLDTTLRERKADAGVVFPLRRVRFGTTPFASFHWERGITRCVPGTGPACRPEGLRPNLRHAVRFGWSFSSAHQYGRSISPVDGWSAAMTSEHVRRAFGGDGRGDAYTGELRGYLRAGGRHSVFAIRAAGGVATGDPRVRRFFTAGGPGPKDAPLDFDSDAVGLMRGFDTNDSPGSRIAVVNADYRWPIARIERGLGTWPFFLRTVHASIFLDAGQAWDRHFRWRDSRTATGGELSLDTVLLYSVPVTLTAGVAWRHDGSNAVDDGPAAFVRVGRAF